MSDCSIQNRTIRLLADPITGSGINIFPFLSLRNRSGLSATCKSIATSTGLSSCAYKSDRARFIRKFDNACYSVLDDYKICAYDETDESAVHCTLPEPNANGSIIVTFLHTNRQYQYFQGENIGGQHGVYGFVHSKVKAKTPFQTRGLGYFVSSTGNFIVPKPESASPESASPESASQNKWTIINSVVPILSMNDKVTLRYVPDESHKDNGIYVSVNGCPEVVLARNVPSDLKLAVVAYEATKTNLFTCEIIDE